MSTKKSRKVAFKDLTGQRFGRLLVLYKDDNPNLKRVRWICQCSCASKTIKSIDASNLSTGHTTSCGCFNKERAIAANTKHGHSGKTYSRTYLSWQKMKDRCYNPKNNRYEYYGARGIQVCADWLNSFENFLKDMGERPEGATLDRKDSNGNYCKENCRWASIVEQANNKTNNVLVQFKEGTLTLKQVAERLSIPYKTLHKRVQKGWNIERAISEPLNKQEQFGDRLETINGQTRTVREWCCLYQAPYSKVRYRCKTLMWHFEKALLTPFE